MKGYQLGAPERHKAAEIAAEAPQAPPYNVSGQKPRFLAADHGVMSAEIAAEAPQAPPYNAAGKNRAFWPRTTE
jgi:hypothetical protein